MLQSCDDEWKQDLALLQKCHCTVSTFWPSLHSYFPKNISYWRRRRCLSINYKGKCSSGWFFGIILEHSLFASCPVNFIIPETLKVMECIWGLSSSHYSKRYDFLALFACHFIFASWWRSGMEYGFDWFFYHVRSEVISRYRQCVCQLFMLK